MRRTAAVTAALIGVAGLGVACGAGGPASGGSGGGEVVVELIAPLTGASGAYDPWKNAALAAVDAANAGADPKARKIKVNVCDAQESANTAAACGSKAVRDNAVAAITMASNEQPYLSYLEKAGIPALGFMTDPVMFTSPVSYSTASAGAAAVQGVLGLAKKQGCKQLVYVRADPQPAAAVAQFGTNWAKAAQQIGIEAPLIQAQPGAADMSSFIAKGLQSNPDCMDVAGYGADEVSLIKAANAADPQQKIRLFTTPSLVSPDAIKSLGPILDRMTGVSFVWDTSAKSQAAHPGVKQFVDEITRYASKPFQLDNNSEVVWSQTRAIIQAVHQVSGDVTAQSVKAALDKTNHYDPGTSPVVSFASPPPSPAPVRMFAPYGIAVKWPNGAAETQGSFFNLYTGADVAGS